MLRYLKHELKYENDLPYQGPFGGGWPPPTGPRGDWMSVKWTWEPSERGGGGSTQPLRAAMTANPALKVFVSCGYYDLVCSYAGNAYVAGHLEPALKQNVIARAYGGAHAIYTDETAKLALKRDVAAFVEKSRGTPVSSAPGEPSAASADGVPAQQIVTTTHRVTVDGKSLNYTARAGLLPIRHNETGETRAHVFFVAYSVERPADGAVRPLTFLWNGGPGSNSTLVHLVGFGPRRIRTSEDATAPPTCECELEDNQATWLDKTDLVFVDPVGTGFSRPTRPEYAADFYSTLKDIASIAEFVRMYLTHFDAWDAPLFIGGESYGVWRAAGVAEALERRGQRVAGVIFISGGIPVGPVVSEEMRTALFVPTRTASAFFHKKLPADLQTDLERTLRTVETWARDEYAPALARRDSLSDSERQAVVTQLARFTGVDPAQIDKHDPQARTTTVRRTTPQGSQSGAREIRHTPHDERTSGRRAENGCDQSLLAIRPAIQHGSGVPGDRDWLLPASWRTASARGQSMGLRSRPEAARIGVVRQTGRTGAAAEARLDRRPSGRQPAVGQPRDDDQSKAEDFCRGRTLRLLE